MVEDSILGFSEIRGEIVEHLVFTLDKEQRDGGGNERETHAF